MKNVTNDRRTRVTRLLIRRAFTELLRRKPIQSITVKELCEEAGINRGTFYAHYTDIYALRDAIEALGGDVEGCLQHYFHLPMLWGRDGKAPDYFVLVGGLLTK